MANDKKFIVKNGLLTPENAVIGSNTDTGEKLQVTGTSKLSGSVTVTQGTAATPSLDVHNSGGYLNDAVIAKFRGDSDALQIQNTGIGDYKLVNSQQNNGIIFYDSTPGVRLLYNNSARLDINSAGNRFYGLSTTTIDGNRILTTADEGSGNGLDADTVDGLEASQFVRSDVDDIMAGNYTIQQNLIVSGDLTVSGNTTYVNTEEILLSDNIITLNANYTGSTPTENAGIEIERGSLDNPKLLWDETQDYWKLISGNLTDLGRIITTADEGSGNGFDADTVDGLEASQFLRSDVDDTANGNITILGDLTIGDNVGGAQINFDGVGNNRTLYSEAGVIGFLNQAFNYSARSDAQGNWIVEKDVAAGEDVYATDNVIAGGNVTANTGSVSAATTVTAGTDVTAGGNVTATTGYVQAATTVTAGTDVIGQRFVDADNNSYVVNPAGTSTMNDIGIDDDLFHNGDTNTKLSFGTDDISLQTGGSERLGIDNDSVDATVTVTAPNVGIDTDLFHNGDTDTKISFTTDELKINTGGATRLTANTGGVYVTNLTASGNVVGNNISAITEVESPIYYDKDDRNYYGDFATTSRLNDISLVGEVIHDGDTDTYIHFSGADSFDVVTGGTTRFTVNNTTATASHSFTAPVFYDSNDNTFYGDFAGTSRINDISLDGQIIHDGDTDTFIDFNAADSLQITTGGVARFTLDNTNLTVSHQIRSPIYYDNNDLNYYGNFASTSRLNDISLVGEIIHDGDTDTYVHFNAADSFQVVAGGTGIFTATSTTVTVDGDLTVTGTITGVDGNFSGDVSANNVTATTAMYAPRFYDLNNNAYYVDPASSSVMNNIGIDDYITHNGDNSYFGFSAADTIVAATDNTVRLTIDSTYVTSTLDGIFPNLYAGRYYDSDNATYYTEPAASSRMNDISLVGEIIHDGDTNTYLEFNAADSFRVVTGGAQRLLVNNSYVLANNQMRSPIFYDSDNTAYYGNFAGTSVMNDINIDDYVRHNGDTDTYIGFDAADNFGVWTNNVNRLRITNTNSTFSHDVLAPRFVDSGDTNYYLDPANASLSATLNGAVRIGSIANNSRWADNTGTGGIALLSYGDDAATSNPTIAISGAEAGGYSLVYLNRIDPSANPTTNGSRYIHFYYDGVDGGSIRGDGSGNLYQVLKAGTNWGFWTSGYSEALIVDDNGDVMVAAGTGPTYTDGGDNTPLTTALNPAKLHVGGSIYLNGNDDGIIFGRGTASFLRDEELGFGWGSGWYMTDATYLRVRNNTSVFSTGDYYGNRFYQHNDTNYYLDPDGDSQLNEVHINDWIRHRGDTNTYIGFPANDQIVLATNGSTRVDITNSLVTANNPVKINAGLTALDIQKTTNGSGVSIRMTDQSGAATQFGTIEFWHADSAITTGANAAFLFRSTEPVTHFVFGSDSDGGGTTAANHAALLPQGNNTGYVGNANYRWQYIYGGTGNFSGNLTAANMYASRYYDADDGNYYVDPNGDSQMNTIDIDDYIRHRGDTDNYIGFPSNDSQTFVTGGAERLEVDNSGVTARVAFDSTVSVAAPIYYDSSGTTYKLNIADGSSLLRGRVDVTGGHGASSVRVYLDPTENGLGNGLVTLQQWVSEPGNTWDGAGFGYNVDNNLNESGNVPAYYFGRPNTALGQAYMRFSADGNLNFYNTPNGSNTRYATMRLDRTGYVLAYNSSRAPIFYDSNNTAYYLDPNQTSNLNGLTMAQVITGPGITGYAGTLIREDNRTISPSELTAGRLKFGFTSWANNNSAPYADFLHLRSYTDSSGGSDNLVMFKKSGIGMRIWQQSWGSTTAYSSYVDVPLYNINPGSGNDFYASRFIDSDETAYLVDPNGTSNIRYLKVNTTGSSSGTRALTIKQDGTGEINFGSYPAAWTSALQIQNNDNTDFVWISPLQNGYNARFRTGGCGLDFYTDGGNDTGTHSAFIGSGYIQGIASVRAPIFRDSDDPNNFYLDPNATSILARIVLPQNPVGTAYAGVATQPTYYIGQTYGDNDAWKMYGESPSGTNSGALILQSEDDYDGNESIRHRFKRTYGAYDTRDNLITYFNYVYSPTSFRSPIFYDSDDTNYYADPNSTSRFANVLIERTQATSILTVRRTGSAPGNNTTVLFENEYRNHSWGIVGEFRTGSGGGGDRPSILFSSAATGTTWSTGFGYADDNFRINQNHGYRNGGWGTARLTIDTSGNVTLSGPLYAPIMYDSNDPSYYIDPNGTSRLNIVNINRLNGADMWSGDIVINGNENTYYPVTWWGGNQDIVTEIEIYRGYAEQAPWNPIGTGVHHGGLTCLLRTNFGGWGGSTYDIQFDDFRETYTTIVSEVAHFGNQRGFVIWLRGGGTGGAIYHIRVKGRNFGPTVSYGTYDPGGNGSGVSPRTDTPQTTISLRNKARFDDAFSSNMYAYRYYDWNNGAYYGDFASTSRINTIDVDRINYIGGGPAYFYTSSGNLRGYIRATESNDSHFEFATSGGEDIIFRDGGFGGSWNQIIRGDGQVLIASRLDTPIMYDLNATAYYVHPGDTGISFNMAGSVRQATHNRPGILTVASGTSSAGASIAIQQETGEGWTAIFADYEPYTGWGFYHDNPNNLFSFTSESGTGGIRSFTVPSRFSGNRTAYEKFRIDQNNGDFITGRTGYAFESFRSPIFYDYTNTNWFVNPDGRSRLSSIDYGNGSYYLAGGDWGYRHNTPYGWIQFGPANTSHAHIYTDRSNFYFNVNYMYMNGRFVLNENFWINNKYFGSGGEIYGTIFYDSNDSAFRWDGTATNGSRFRGVHYETMAYMQLPGHTRSSKEYYAARPRITSDTNYWTGAVGWGTVNMDTVGDWGSGFFDSWSNPANQPAGTSHWVGVQSYHYSNGSARYGWQMAGGPIQGLWFRNSWPGFSSWKKIAMYGVNEYSGDFYASRFVDADNSSYYMDPNSYSRLDVTDTNESYTYGWFRNRNSGRGLYNQSTGMHWYTTNGYWRSAGGGYGYGGILMYNNYESDLRGYCGYYDGSGFGMLNSSGNWQIRIEYGNANMELYRVTYMNDARPYIIYDRNDTGYRLDPNSTSNEALRVRGGTLYGPNPSWGRYLAVGTNGHWTTSFASVACTNGNLHLDSQGGYGTYLQWYVGGTTYVNGSLQANIFYDRDNTGYYFGGGSGTTQMSDAYANDWFRPQGCSGIYFQSYGRGMRAPECEGNSYGNVTTYGGGRNGWQGWGIGSRHVLMSTGGDNVGLHDNSRGWIWYWNGSYTQWNYGYNYFGGDVRSWRFYDHDTSYYGDFNDWSRMYGVGSFYLRNNYDVSTNHQYGMYMANGLSTAYAIFREGGGWGYPYPDMRIAFHTGLKFGANPSYEGMRFYTDYDMSSLVWQFNGGSNYSYQYRWNNLTGYHGIYSGINNAHFYPNPDSYGSWRVIGSRNGWGGLQFDSGICLMMNQTVHGFYSTIYGWRLYLDGSLYCPGNVVAYWSDRRLKENIQELSRGEGLDTIMKLKPSRFNWRKEAFDATGGVIEGGLEEVSVIAQDTQEVLPNAVVINKTSGGKTNVVIDGEEVKDYLTVNYDKITPFLIQAIKDLKAEVDELREQLRQERNK